MPETRPGHIRQRRPVDSSPRQRVGKIMASAHSMAGTFQAPPPQGHRFFFPRGPDVIKRLATRSTGRSFLPMRSAVLPPPQARLSFASAPPQPAAPTLH